MSDTTKGHGGRTELWRGCEASVDAGFRRGAFAGLRIGNDVHRSWLPASTGGGLVRLESDSSQTQGFRGTRRATVVEYAAPL